MLKSKIKLIFLFILSIQILICGMATEAQNVILKVSSFQKQYVSGEAVYLAIQIENKTDQDISFSNDNLGQDFELSVKYSNGELVPLSALSKALRQFGGGIRAEYFSLKHDENVVMVLNLNRYYDFSKSGKYDIAVGRNDIRQHDEKVVKVKTTLQLEITEDASMVRNAKHTQAVEIINKFNEQKTSEK